METYKFTNKAHHIDGMYGVEYDSLPESELALVEIAWQGWTVEIIQNLIKMSESLNGDEEFDFQVPGSDFLISIDANEVFFYDMKNNKAKEDFIWKLDVFLEFMANFKSFIKNFNTKKP